MSLNFLVPNFKFPTSPASLHLFFGKLVLTILASSLCLNAYALDGLKSTKDHEKTMQQVIATLAQRHYRKTAIDDELSSRFLDKYIESLDPAKSFFFASDIAEFEKHRKEFDDDFKQGDLEMGFRIFNRYRERVMVRSEAIIANLENEDISYDFTQDDDLVVDIEQAKWATDQATANQMWHKRIKSNLLGLMLTDKTLEESKDILVKRYQRQLNQLLQQDSTDVCEIYLNALTLLYDPHTNYLSPATLANFNISMSLRLEGIGAELRLNDDEYTEVMRIVPGGPASRQGDLKAGDRITAVGQADSEMENVIGWRTNEVVKLIRGTAKTVVRLEVLNKENVTRIVSITRGLVKLEDSAAQKAVFQRTDGENLYKIGVIDIPTFYMDFEAFQNGDPNYKSTSGDVEKLLNELAKENVDGVILDLRNNGGGSLREATSLTDLFIDKGPVVQIRYSNERIYRHSQSRSPARYRGPLIVLTNRLSASASEIFAGAIQDYKRGLIVGNRTFGKGTVQSLMDVHEGQVKVTESKFYRVSGDSTQHRGVIPDIAYFDMIDIEEIGESAYDSALPWDQIHADTHAEYYNLQNMLPFMQSRHDERASKDPDFVFLVDQVELAKKNSDRKVVSLNEEKRRAEQLELENKALALENKRRLAKGLEPYKTLDEAREESESEQSEQSASNARNINPDEDPILNETGYVLIDYIKLLEADRVERLANF
ncbi:carboxy terminal-processing peptidase [Aurantivibrio infirmus]